MKVLNKVPLEEVIEHWARRESTTPSLLKLNRAPLLQELPEDTEWYRIQLYRSDFLSLRLINEEASWNILTSSTGRFDVLIANFLNFSKNPPLLPKVMLPNGITLQQYFDNRMSSLDKFRKSAGDPDHNLELILIGSCLEGPFTILEGNHTAVGLYFLYLVDHPELEYPVHKSYLGISKFMAQCKWFQKA